MRVYKNPHAEIGETYGRLTVEGILDEKDTRGRRILECSCACGIRTQVVEYNLVSGRTRSCGCLIGRARSHVVKTYDPYEWLNDAIKLKLKRELELELESEPELEPEPEPEPEPTHAEVPEEPSAPREGVIYSRPMMLEYNGCVLTLAQWGAETGLSSDCIRARINKGWDVEKALTTPVMDRAENLVQHRLARLAETADPEKDGPVITKVERLLTKGDRTTKELFKGLKAKTPDERLHIKHVLNRMVDTGRIEVLGKTCTVRAVNIYHLVKEE